MEKFSVLRVLRRRDPSWSNFVFVSSSFLAEPYTRRKIDQGDPVTLSPPNNVRSGPDGVIKTFKLFSIDRLKSKEGDFLFCL